jgi:hypothetical protein
VVIDGVPSDNTTLLEILDELSKLGYDGSMTVTAEGKLRCPECGAEIDPSEVHVHETRRLEGASDPDDMMIVLGVECARCSEKAALVLHYGPEASSEEMELLKHLAPS